MGRELQLKIILYRALEGRHRRRTTDRGRMREIRECYFNDLFVTTVHVTEIATFVSREDISPILRREINSALWKIYSGKGPGKDGIIAEHLKAG